MEASRELVTINKLPPYKEEKAPPPQINSPVYRNLCDIAAELLGRGTSIIGTARKLGLHENTVEYWLKTSHFVGLVEQKKEEYRLKLLDRIDEAGNKTWFANAWILERNKAFKGEFAQPKASPAGSGNIQINVVVGTSPTGPGGTTVTVGQAPGDGENG